MGDRELALCLPCKSSGESNPASKYCIDCHEPLCKTCVNCHMKFRSTKTHKLVDCSKESIGSFLDVQRLTSYMFCPNHTNKAIEIKCEVHNTLCCLICATVDHRNCQTVCEIAKIAYGYRSSGQTENIRAHLEGIKSCVEEIITVNEDCRRDFEKSKEEIPKQLEQVKIKFLKLFEKAEFFIKEKMNTLQNNEDISIGNREETWRLKLNDQNSLLKMLDSLLEIGTDLQIYVAVHKIKEILAETEMALKNQGNCISGMRFNLDIKEKLKALLDTDNIETLVDIESVQNQYQLPKNAANTCSKSGLENESKISSDTLPENEDYSAKCHGTLRTTVGANQENNPASVAEHVANKAHRLNNIDRHVTLYKPRRPRPLYNDRLIIKGVSATTTKDCLFNFLEAKSGASANQLIYGEQDGTVMVIFDSEPDFDTLVKVCERRPLEGSTLTASKVRTSNCILVSDLKPTTSGDTVQNYFENRKRSNGGDIERVKMLEETGTCHVFFQDYAVVDDVIKIKHRLEGQNITVKIYIEELGRCQDDGSELRVKIPDSISIENVEEKIVNFIRKNNSCIEAVNKQLDGCYAKVVCPEKGSTIVVECEITVKTPDYRKLVKNWKSEVEKNLMDYINQLCCEEHPVWDEGWDAVLGGLGEINIQNPDSVALFVDKKDKKIRVVGYRHTVEPVSKMVLKVIKSVSDEIERKKQTVKQTISNLKPLHLCLLLALKYPNEMEKKFPNLKVRINQGKNELVYEGIQTDIQTAKVEMYEEANSFSVRVLENITQNCCDLFQSKQVKDYIVKKLKAQKLVGVWEAVNLKLAVCSYETDLSSCVEFISESVQEKTLQVTKESSTVLTSQLWVDRLHEIHSKNPGVCKVSCKKTFQKFM